MTMNKKVNASPALFDIPKDEFPAVNPFAVKACPRLSLLSLDIATNCGWCTHTASGTWHLAPKKDESKGMRLIRFRAKVKEICALEAIQLIVFEGPAVVGKYPNTVAIEMMGVLKLFAEESAIEYRSYAPSEIKKFGTGKGNAPKERMMEAAMIYKTDVADEDEADAILLYHLAKKDLEL